MSKKLDLSGQSFGYWVAIKQKTVNRRSFWLCKCICGTERLVPTDALRRGTSKSCGCMQVELSRNTQFNDLTGKHFGRWLVLYLVSREKYKSPVWHCKCECGNEKDVSQQVLLNGHSTSCGCYNKEKGKYNLHDLTGQRFGKLVVMYKTDKRQGRRIIWHCKCDCGNEYEVIGSSLLNGSTKSCGCLKSEAVVGNKLFIEGQRFGHLLALYNTEKKDRHGRYIWRCKCDCGKEIDVGGFALMSGNTSSCGCTSISHIGSKAENEIKEYIEQINGREFKKIKILDNKEIDLYNDELKLGIEYNGSVYHATINGLYDDKPKDYHQQKFLLAKEKGIHLINIFDVDYDKNKEKILAYLKDIIKVENRLYARQCKIQYIDKQLAWEFYDKYHLQGKSYLSQINYGLYYGNTLMACIGFGKLRMKDANKKDGYELHRYCVRHGYSVVGGVQKLFKRFLSDYSPKYIKSYSDNNYFLGNMYERLGFSYLGQATISYFWVLKNKKLKREQCQVKKLKELYPEVYAEALEGNISNKEDYIMSKLGACKVYTAGNSIWEWKVS